MKANKCPPRRGYGRGTGQHPVEVLTMAKATCSIDGCGRLHFARGWCHRHYVRWWKHGDPLVVIQVRPPGSPEVRFWAKVDQHGPDGFHSQTGANLGPCWLWTATPNSKGYGELGVDGRMVKAHRFAYEMLVGPIPTGLVPDHLCRVRHCVRPTHLEPVTQRENLLRGDTLPARNAVKTHCPHGHAFSPENTYVTREGWRQCRACGLARATERYARVRTG